VIYRLAIGIIGGTGVYDASVLENIEEIKVDTPYGKTSDVITKGRLKGKQVYILPRHGKEH
jgi:5'-methylthioadenosine phosphorylase